MRHAIRMLLAPVLLGLGGCGGCGGDATPPAPTGPSDEEISEEIGQRIGDEVVGAIGQRLEELEAKTVVILVLDRPEERDEQIRSELKALLSGESHSVGWRARWLRADGQDLNDLFVTEYRAAPVDDVRRFAASLEFGAVLAVDAAGRQILVDCGAAKTPPESWGGADQIAAKLQETERESISDFLADQGENLVASLAKGRDPETIAYVLFEGRRAGPPSGEFNERLKRAVESLGVEWASTGWHFSDVEARLAMVTGHDLEAFVGAVDFAEARWIDPKRRLVIFTYDGPEPETPGADTTTPPETSEPAPRS